MPAAGILTRLARLGTLSRDAGEGLLIAFSGINPFHCSPKFGKAGHTDPIVVGAVLRVVTSGIAFVLNTRPVILGQFGPTGGAVVVVPSLTWSDVPLSPEAQTFHSLDVVQPPLAHAEIRPTMGHNFPFASALRSTFSTRAL